ncbi:hypothetical protein A2U01_0092066, partial [Trifolium medium]|nr:hypothetical protein [Trifolium medium]
MLLISAELIGAITAIEIAHRR